MGTLTKVSMNLSKKSLSNIEEIGKITGQENKTRVISDALQIAKEILSRTQDNKIILRDNQGNDQELYFIL